MLQRFSFVSFSFKPPSADVAFAFRSESCFNEFWKRS